MADSTRKVFFRSSLTIFKHWAKFRSQRSDHLPVFIVYSRLKAPGLYWWASGMSRTVSIDNHGSWKFFLPTSKFFCPSQFSKMSSLIYYRKLTGKWYLWCKYDKSLHIGAQSGQKPEMHLYNTYVIFRSFGSAKSLEDLLTFEENLKCERLRRILT